MDTVPASALDDWFRRVDELLATPEDRDERAGQILLPRVLESGDAT